MAFLQGLSGLGDSVFLYPTAAQAAERGHLTIGTNYPEVFAALPFRDRVSFVPFARSKVNVSYTRQRNSNYFEDYLRSSKIETQFFYDVQKPSETVSAIMCEARKSGKIVTLVHPPLPANMHVSRADYSFAPMRERFVEWLSARKDRMYFICAQDVSGYTFDVRVKLTLPDYLALCGVVDHIASQWGHLLPIAQGLGKVLTVFNPRGPLSGFARNLTTEMLLVRESRLRNPAPVFIW